ncbi:LOW QUALITY PROTEIN: hypothetical protein BC936DRAFT_145604 [Jimgerdemannia flammicorona]|uniref:Uncharacterized protein n=1 Tax=Jimgerdemannia flammicorona TaxID=994334 RepID=A0A433D9K2_9FUNG|nr:LOW QUALITY PROTEIN: hypothetical protein BC936DRAFT_145604 [Jimgerdemannia flammicorona]
MGGWFGILTGGSDLTFYSTSSSGLTLRSVAHADESGLLPAGHDPHTYENFVQSIAEHLSLCGDSGDYIHVQGTGAEDCVVFVIDHSGLPQHHTYIHNGHAGVLLPVARHPGLNYEHIRNYLNDIFMLIEDYWNLTFNIQITIIMLIEVMAVALDGEFKIYLPKLLLYLL